MQLTFLISTAKGLNSLQAVFMALPCPSLLRPFAFAPAEKHAAVLRRRASLLLHNEGAPKRGLI